MQFFTFHLMLLPPPFPADVWVGLRQRRSLNDGTACLNANCEAKSFTWNDGSPFVYDATKFSNVYGGAGEWCTLYSSALKNLYSKRCYVPLRTVCQIDCRPGKISVLPDRPYHNLGASKSIARRSLTASLLFCERWNQVRAGYLPGMNLILGRQVVCLCNNRNKTVLWQEYINPAKEQFLSCSKTKIRFFPVIDPEKSWHILWSLNFMSMCKSQSGEVVES